MPANAESVFHAIADANRRKLIDLLADGEKPVHVLAGDFDISFAAVSQHLSVLRSAGLVTSRAKGRHRIYRLNPAGLRAVDEWTGKYRRFWAGRLNKLRKVLGQKTT
jgi:DNA-binding transcriptional ArsR family regulator